MIKINDLTTYIPISLPAELGIIVRQARKKAGLTQKEAASLCKVGTRFLSDMESGKPSLQLGKAIQVLRAFGLTMIIKEKTL